ncbi:hypothetical protein MPTK1_2g18195 [Marchantia polymorpha subsp. ruderalis]
MAHGGRSGQAGGSDFKPLFEETIQDRNNKSAYPTTVLNIDDLEDLAKRTWNKNATDPANTEGPWDTIDSMLRQQRHPVFSNSAGLTALHVAAKFGRLLVVRELLLTNKCTEFEAETADGQTALHMAAISGHDEIVRWLVEHYPSEEEHSLESYVNRRDHHISEPETRQTSRPKVKPSRTNSNTFLPMFLRHMISGKRKQGRVQCEPSNNHRTALHYAVQHGHVKVVKLLLEFEEVEVNARDSDGMTPLYLAILSLPTLPKLRGADRLSVIRELLSHPSIDVNAQSSEPGHMGDTPLHVAVRIMDPEVVDLLCCQRMLVATKRNQLKEMPLRLAWEHKPPTDAMDCIKGLLLRRPDVERAMDELTEDKALLHTAVNSLLVGGTLLASLTFAGVLKMPALPHDGDFTPYTGLKQFYNRAVDIFRGSNNMCFFLSIITLMLVIQVPITKRRSARPFAEQHVEKLRIWILLISFCLTLATSCAVMAFVSAGLAKVPVSESGWSRLLYRWGEGHFRSPVKSTMLMTTLLGCLFLALILGYNLFTDYFFIFRDYLSSTFSIRSSIAVFFALSLLVSVITVVALLSVGVGLLAERSRPDYTIPQDAKALKTLRQILSSTKITRGA